MRILARKLKKGFLKVCIDNLDDLWILNQIIERGDLISGKTKRKIEESKEVKPIFLKIMVEKIDFRIKVLRLLGRIVEAPEEVGLGLYHSFILKPGSEIAIEKERWKEYQLRRIRDAVEASKRPRALICVFEPGQADFAIARGYGLSFVGSFSRGLPGKDAKDFDLRKQEFFIELAKRIEEISKRGKIERIILGAVSFDLESFLDQIREKFPELLKKATFCKVSVIGRTGINEVIKRGVIEKIVKQDRISEETKLIEALLEEIARRSGLAIYGLENVREGSQVGAIAELLISDLTLIDYKDEGKLPLLEELIAEVEKRGGEVRIISSDHEAGKKLRGIHGIAARLRFRIS